VLFQNKMHFKFKAIRKNNERYEGTRESQSKFSLYNEIKAEGDMLISAEEIKKGRFMEYLYKAFGFLGNISVAQKINFAKNLSAMTKAGLSLSRSLSVIENQTKNLRFKSVVEGINLEIKKGKTLSEAFKNYPNIFSNLFISMAKAGEESGGLSSSLANVALQMDKTYRLQKKVKGAMIYPGVIISVMIVVGILMFIFVVPGITATFKELNTDLPASTKVIIGLSDFLTGHWLLSILIIILSVLGVYFLLKTKSGKKAWDRTVIRLPLVGDLIKEANAGRMARTLSSLLLAGVPVADSIQITKDMITNHYYRRVLDEAAAVVERGENISSVFMKNPDLYPTFVGEMMGVGEETGNMSAMLLEVAIFYENDVEERTKDLSTIIEPVLMVVIGVAVGFFALSMVAPIYSVMDKV
jgi:type IV pilus assembly protein PilC